MTTRAAVVTSLLLVGLGLVAGIVLYPHLADPMPSHWNAAGEVDGYLPRVWGILLIPLLTAGLVGLMVVLPAIDPKRANIETFRRPYNAFIVGFTAFMMLVQGLVLAAGLGHSVDMSRIMLPAVGLLLIGVGGLVRSAKRNYFIGIRTPWTLDDEQVWDATHRVGARAFFVAGALMVLAGLIGTAGLWVMLAAVAIAAVVPIVYSYLLWRRLHPDGSSR